MSDPIGPTDAPVDAPPAGDVAPAPAAEPAANERTYSPAEYRAVQNEAKNLRMRLRDIEGAATQHSAALEAAKSEAEAIRAAHASATEELRAHRLRQAISEAGRGDDDLRGIDPDLVAPHLSGVEWGDDGKPKAVAAALRDVVKRFPQLVSAPRVPTQPPAGSAITTAASGDLVAQKRPLYPTF